MALFFVVWGLRPPRFRMIFFRLFMIFFLRKTSTTARPFLFVFLRLFRNFPFFLNAFSVKKIFDKIFRFFFAGHRRVSSLLRSLSIFLLLPLGRMSLRSLFSLLLLLFASGSAPLAIFLLWRRSRSFSLRRL